MKMIEIKPKSRNTYLVNDKLVKISGNKIIYLDNLSSSEKKSFIEYSKSLK